MAMTDLQLLRLDVADPYKYGFDEQTGDGATTQFRLSHSKIKASSYKVFVDNTLMTETSQYAIDADAGLLTMVTAPADTKIVRTEYQFTAFSDAELTEFLSIDGGVTQAAIHCLDILLFDSARRFDYVAGDSELKPSQVFAHLKDLRKILQEKLSQASGGAVMGVRLHEDRDRRVQTVDISRRDY